MIGMLKGVVEAIGAEEAVIDVHGVGYLVGAGTRTLARLEPGQAVVLHIETHVREDAFKLYGFTDDLDRAWFVRLQEIQGVGAKAALSILDVLPPHELANATALGDKAAFARAKGVGPKLATRIATELKDKAPPVGRSFSIGLPVHGDADAAPNTAPQTPVPPSAGAARDDAVSALLNLGYPESIARQAVATVMRDAGSDAPISDLIRLSLRVLAP
ncbi:Holliday junction branch migration protein RuvA [Maricaulis sp.]|uniref:Holliday junction branch migration protein RuvA n=1 Tax=Maricaulis sp. TaxID=1486257 RepID=UPI003A914680